MTEAVVGRTVEEAEHTFKKFHQMVTSQDPIEDEYDPLSVLSGVREFPIRVKCATLAWHTLDSALHGNPEVTTE